jgi:CheY-like chemotaxis protein
MGKTILLADKSITIQKIVELTFADEQFLIKSVNDGQAALDLIPQLQPDVILADISLPVRNGYELCSTLRTDPGYQAFSGIPVILLAGIYETMDEERARQVEERVKEVGADDLLSKPFDPQLLTAKVKELMERGTAAEEPPAPEIVSEEAAQPQAFFDVPPLSEEPLRPSEDFGEVEAPADESEETMMVNGQPSAPSPMFAEVPPFEPEPPAVEEPPKVPVDVDAVKPVEEPVFEPEEMQAADMETVVEEESAEAEGIEPEPGGAFQGREEIEYPAAEEVLAAEPAGVVLEESPFETAVLQQPIVAAGEEPFGDVFEEPVAQPDWSGPAIASEEDSPFGLPESEQPPEPAAAGPEPLLPAEEVTSPAAVVEEPEQLEAEEHEELEQLEAEEHEELEEMIEETPAKPDFGEDTWTKAKAEAEQEAVEELFDEASAPQPVTQELIADQIERPALPEEAAVKEPEPRKAPPQVQPVSSVEISDEVIDRIAERVVARLSERLVSEIVWQVVPDLAEKMIRRELEKLHAGGEE